LEQFLDFKNIYFFLILVATVCEVEELTPGDNIKDILSGIFLPFLGNLEGETATHHIVDIW